jgi:serine/threonine protein phosphatase 1
VFGRFFKSAAAKPPLSPASVGDRLVYAVGDVHGRLDLLNALLLQICIDVVEARPDHQPTLIFLGDYVDRGPASKGVIDRILALKLEAAFRVHALKGNHEEQMLAFLADCKQGPVWAEFGGAETLASYGVVPPKLRTDMAAWENARLALEAALPESHTTFLRTLELAIVSGDYVFVHAGLRPGVPLEEQSERDLIWIRDEFLSHGQPFEKVVVHGHTPDAAPHMGQFRIGIDTGAYATGTLTAVRLRNEARFILQTGSRA